LIKHGSVLYSDGYGRVNMLTPKRIYVEEMLDAGIGTD
jgi:hypothetical protein